MTPRFNRQNIQEAVGLLMQTGLLFVMLAALGFLGISFPSAINDAGLPATAVARDFEASEPQRAYVNEHPRVLFDEGHNNADTTTGRYKPFVELITGDGYSVLPNNGPLSGPSLKDTSVLVIVNASGPSSQRDVSAFTEKECDAIRDWVSSGGALLLITDNAPYSVAVGTLSKRFDVDLTKGYTIDNVHYNKEAEDQTELVFTRENHLIVDHPITLGRNAGERINRIMTFSGTSLKGPKDSVAFLKLADSALDVLPPDPLPPAGKDEAPRDHKTVSAAGRAQAVAFGYGKGRVVVLAEAAMFTAQVASRGFQFGFNVPGIDNRQLVLNTMHWLSGLLK
jgi:hypothetical protein